MHAVSARQSLRVLFQVHRGISTKHSSVVVRIVLLRTVSDGRQQCDTLTPGPTGLVNAKSNQLEDEPDAESSPRVASWVLPIRQFKPSLHR